MLRLAPRGALAVIVAAGAFASLVLWTVGVHVNAQQTNRVPEFREGDSAIRVVAEGTAAGQNVGEPVEAVDPGDTLSYSLAGGDAGHFGINSSSGQILTSGNLKYDTKGSYSVIVAVSDGADDGGEPDTETDDTIEIVIRVSVSVDLNDWTAEKYNSDTPHCESARWTVDANGRARETGGEAPSILYGDFDAYGKRLTAKVHPGSDDDFFGFVVGFNGGDSTNAEADYLLVDWKKQRQEFNFEGDSTSTGGYAEVGLRLSRVTGIPDCDEFWQHANLSGTDESSGLEELQEADTKGSIHYAAQEYEFVIDFGAERIEVYLDGGLELGLDGEFSDGKFGAYAMLHNSAVFWDFSYTDGSFTSSSEPVDQAGEVVLSSAVSEVGVSITATLTDPDGSVTNQIWQWERSPDQAPPIWSEITDADSSSYTPSDSDAGKLLRVRVTYDDSLGTGKTATSAATLPADRLGTLTLSPMSPVAGEEVQATLVDADGGIANQVWVWESSPDANPPTWSTISGATSAAYTPTSGDAGLILRTRVAYDDAVGTGRTAVSAATRAVDQRGSVALVPNIPVAGEAVAAMLADPDGGITSEVWKWERSPGMGEPVWSIISGAGSSSYTPTAPDDAGKRLRVVVSYSDSTGTGRSATSGASDRVDRRGVVRVSTAVPDVGIEVITNLEDADGGVTGEAWQWQRSPSTGTPAWSNIVDADGDAYTPVAGDEGMVLRAVAEYDDAVGSGRSAISVATEKVGKPGVVSLDSSMPVVGEELTAMLTDADGMITNEVWQWESSPAGGRPSWNAISGATSDSYTPETSDAGRLLRVRATYTDDSGGGRVAQSPGTARVDQRGSVTVSPDPPVVGKPVRATLVDADGSITNQVWKWERSPHGAEEDREWAVIAGAATNSYRPTADEDAGKLLRVTVSYDDGTGMGRSATSSATKRVDREGTLTVSPSPPVAGQVVTATLMDGDGSVVNQVWKWERSVRTGALEWVAITGASAHAYTPVASGDGGMLLRATVTYEDAVGTGKTAVSPSTLPVDRLGMVDLSTTMPVAGEVVTATLTDGDDGVLNEKWQWESSPDQATPSWTEIAGAGGRAYAPSGSLAGNLLRATVEYDDATGRDRQAASDATEPLDQRGSVSVTPTDPVAGEALMASLTDADGSITNRSWVWESSPDQEEPDWSVISDAEEATYVPKPGDAGRILRARVTYDDGTGMGRTAVSEPTSAVDQRGAVTLSPRTPVAGEAVTATLSDPDGDVSEEVWKWESSPGEGAPVWTVINGASSSSYTPISPDDAGKRLRAMVGYADGTGGGRSAISQATNRVDQRGALMLSTIVPDVGTVVEAVLTDADGGVTEETWQWQSSPSSGMPSWSDISGADDSSYSPVSADEGLLLRALVEYDDAIGTGRRATSVGTGKVGKAGVVSLDSTMPVVGEPLTATLTDVDGSVSDEVWQWESSPAQENPSWSGIAGADAYTYTPQASDVGRLLRVRATYADGSGSNRVATSEETERVDQRGSVTVSPDPPVVGKAARATLTDPDGSVTNQAWSWERSAGTGDQEWTTISGAQSSSYTPTAADDSGRLLRVIVVYDDGAGVGRSAVSDATKQVDQAGVVTVSPSPPVAGESVTASLMDADGSVTKAVWTWERSPRTGTPVWEVISGATSASYTPTADDDGGKILRVAVDYDDGIGTGRTAMSASTLPVDRLGVVSLSTSMPVAGEAVMATLTDDDGGILNKKWQWESSPDQEELSWSVIAGAEASSYTPRASIAGRVLRVVVRYDDATGRGRVAESGATEPLDQRGVVTLSSSTPVVGQRLTASLSDRDGGITDEAWVWESLPDADRPKWVAIAGASSENYTPTADVAGRLLRARVSYADGVGMGRSAVSEPTDAVDQRGAVTLVPSPPVVGEVVTAILSDADGRVANEVWRWERSPGTGNPKWTVIDGAETRYYTPVGRDDAGKRLRAVVVYTDGARVGRSTDGAEVGRSAASAASDRVDSRGEVMLSTEVPDVGIAVEATLMDGDGGVAGEVWQWQSSPATGMAAWTDIVGASSSKYTPAESDEGNLLRAVVMYGDAVGAGRRAASAASAKVGKPGVVSLSTGVPVSGRGLTAMLEDADGGITNEVWGWEWSPGEGVVVWMEITDATSASYTPIAGDAGYLLRAVVTYGDGSGSGRIARSQATARVDQLGTVVVESRNDMVDMPEVGVWQDAVLTDADRDLSNEVWLWEMSPGGPDEERAWTVITGAQSSSYKPVGDDAGKVLRVSVTYNDGTGTGIEATSAATERVDHPGTIELSSYSDVVVGTALDATIVDSDGGITNVVWEWRRSPKQDSPTWTVIEGAVSATYTPTDADGGLILGVIATYDDGVGAGRKAESASTGVVDRPGVVTVSPQAPEVGEQVEAELEDGDEGVRDVEWRWESSPSSGEPMWEEIPGSPELGSYTPSSSVSGRLLRAVANYSEPAGERTAASAATMPVSQPGVVTLDSIEATVGVAIRAVLADADGDVTGEMWHWQRSADEAVRNWRYIPGANSQAYVPVPGDAGMLLKATVSYADSIAAGRMAESRETLPVDQPGVVTLSSVEPLVGQVIRAMLVDPDGGVGGEEWEWERSDGESGAWEGIPGANTDMYEPTGVDVGYRLRAKVVYGDIKAAGRISHSEPTLPVYQMGTVALSPKVPVVGEPVTARFSHTDSLQQDLTWRWDSSPGTGTVVWTDIPDANSATYTPTLMEAGRVLRARVGYEDGNGMMREAMSLPSARVDRRGSVVVTPQGPVVGGVIKAALSDADGGITNEEWQWERRSGDGSGVWAAIAGAVSADYTPVGPEDAGVLLRVRVTYDDDIGNGRVAVSAPTDRVDRRGTVELSTRVPDVGVGVEARLSDPDGEIAKVEWQWERSAGEGVSAWEIVAGGDEATYVPVAADEGMVLRATVSYDDAIGRGRHTWSTATELVGKPGEVAVDSDTAVVGEVLTATLMDPDGSVSNVMWHWESSGAGTKLIWEVIEGAVSDAYTPVGGDRGRMLRAGAIYDDASGAGRIAMSKAIGPVGGRREVIEPTVSGSVDVPATTALSRYNRPPVFEEGMETEREIALGWAGAKAGNPVIATDDSGESLLYLLTGRDSMFFEVNPATGQVRIDKRLAFLRPGVYLVTLHAIDSSSGFASIEISIRVLQFSVPAFSEGDRAIRKVLENLPAGALVGPPVRAKDRDGDTVVYSLVGGDGSLFQVDAGTGQIRTRETLDRESQETYALILQAEERRGGRDVIEVEVQVEDQNEPPKLDGMVKTDLTVVENSAPGAAVGGRFEAHDPERDLLEYSLLGEDGDSFAIISSTGQLVTKDVLDYEARSDYEFIVRVEDGRGGSDEVEAMIEVVDINEAPMFGGQGFVEVVVPEDLPEGGAVGEPLVAKDPEGDRLAYSLSGDGAISFDIDVHTGLVMSKGPLDFESRSFYLVEVSVVDGKGGSDSIYVSIRVADVDEAVPGLNEERDTETAVGATDSHSEASEPPTLSLAKKGPEQDEDAAFEPDAEEFAVDASHEAPAPVSSGGQSDDVGTVGDEPVDTPPVREVVEQSDYGVDIGDDAGIEAVETSFVGGPNEPLETDMGSFTGSSGTDSSGERLPLWVVLVLLVLPYIDGILLLAAWYRLWGSPRGRRALGQRL